MQASEGFGLAQPEEPAGGWIRMPVRAPVTDPESRASVRKDGETSGAKFLTSVMTTHNNICSGALTCIPIARKGLHHTIVLQTSVGPHSKSTGRFRLGSVDPGEASRESKVNSLMSLGNQ
jgi:hypothetical protein